MIYAWNVKPQRFWVDYKRNCRFLYEMYVNISIFCVVFAIIIATNKIKRYWKYDVYVYHKFYECFFSVALGIRFLIFNI